MIKYSDGANGQLKASGFAYIKTYMHTCICMYMYMQNFVCRHDTLKPYKLDHKQAATISSTCNMSQMAEEKFLTKNQQHLIVKIALCRIVLLFILYVLRQNNDCGLRMNAGYRAACTNCLAQCSQLVQIPYKNLAQNIFF